jgi:diguanylate cyclase (GGDEF)-like protein
MGTDMAAGRDALTGLLIRDVAFRLLAERVRPAAVVLVDLDDVSALNDRFGYEPVDEALVEIAARLDGVAAGAAARLGGDEFLLVVASPVGSLEPAAVAMRVREVISGEPVRVSSGIRIDVTAGVVAAPLESGGDPLAILRELDVLLQETKRGFPPSSAA